MADLPDSRWLEWIGLPTVGAILGHLWTRFRNRLVKLNWSVSHTSLAFGTEDFGLGKVEVLYNGTPVLNIHGTTVNIQNDSNTDLENLVVTLRFSPGTNVLRSNGNILGGQGHFPFSEEYSTALTDGAAGRLSGPQMVALARSADHRIPVLNRGAVATLGILTSRQDYMGPTVEVGIDHKGVRLVHQPPVAEVFGTRRSVAQVVGLVAGALIVIALVSFAKSPWLIAFASWIAGFTILAIGAALAWLFKKVGRLVS